MISWLLLAPLLMASSRQQDPPSALSSALDQLAEAELVIVHTANTAGYLKSCGCSKRDVWGLSQQAAIIERVREQGRPTLVLDSGDLSDKAAEWNTIARCLAVMGYDAITCGQLDAKAAESGELTLPADGPAVVGPSSCGVVDGVVPEAGILFRAGAVEVGVVGSGPPGVPGERSDRLTSLSAEAVSLKERGADVVIVLSALGAAADLGLAKQAQGAVDVLLGAGDWQAATTPITIGRTVIFPTAQGGKKLSLISSLHPHKAELTWRHARLSTSAAHAGHPVVTAVLREHFGSAVKDEAARPPRSQPELRYVRATECRACHRAQYDAWGATGHARAEATLRRDGRVLAECLVCHSEQHRRGNQPVGETVRRASEGVECSACHGDGLLHSLDPRSTADIGVPEDESLCAPCHTLERSPDFHFRKYLARIRH